MSIAHQRIIPTEERREARHQADASSGSADVNYAGGEGNSRNPLNAFS
jgi:hypothetical protein